MTHQDMKYCGFEVGQHIVCIDDSGWDEYRRKYRTHGWVQALIWPEKGKVYTVRSVFVDPFHRTTSLHLAEIVNVERNWMGREVYENGWLARRFRPLQKLTPEQFMQTDAPVESREAVA